MRKVRKLALHRETVLDLDRPFLERVAGGNSAEFSNCAACSAASYCGHKCQFTPVSYVTNCDSCGNTCTCD